MTAARYSITNFTTQSPLLKLTSRARPRRINIRNNEFITTSYANIYHSADLKTIF